MLGQLRQRSRRLFRSQFVRNVTSVATGIAAAQAISLTFMPFLARLYGPEAFGALAAFSAVVNITTPFATFGYSNAIVMPETEEGATAVARLSLLCAAVISPLSLILVFLFRPQLAALAGLEATPGALYLIPVSLLLGALLSVANQTAIREGLFKAKAGSHVASTLVMNISKLAGGFLAASGLTLIIISMIGRALNFSMLLARVPRQGAFHVRRWFGTAGVREAAKKQRDFAIYRLPQSVIYATSLGLPVILLTSMFGPSVAGQYSIITLLLGAPVMLLGQSVMEVLFPKITVAVREKAGNASSLLMKAILGTALLSVVPFGVITLWGHQIFPFVLGTEWDRAGELSRWVAIWMASVLVAQPAIAAMPILRLQKSLLAYEILITVARVVAIILGAHWGDDLTAVAAFSCVNFVGYLLLTCFVQRHAKYSRV